MCALALTIAVPLRTYLSQRADLAEQEQRQVELREEVARLEQQRDRMSDPAQVEAEARRRLGYVMPGETPYVVQLPEDDGRDAGSDGHAGAESSGPWYEGLWGEVTEK